MSTVAPSLETTVDYTPAAQRILDVAERMVAERGFNAVSYADVARELAMTKPSLHYHFATKADLGAALVVRYHARFAAALDELDRDALDAPAKLQGYADLYLDVLSDGRMCLCGILAAEYLTLPEPMQEAVLAFFSDNERWLDGVLAAGRDAGELHFTGAPGEVARLILSGLEGAMLVARPLNDVERFRATAASLLGTLQR